MVDRGGGRTRNLSGANRAFSQLNYAPMDHVSGLEPLSSGFAGLRIPNPARRGEDGADWWICTTHVSQAGGSVAHAQGPEGWPAVTASA
jgi:hypothetical protein